MEEKRVVLNKNTCRGRGRLGLKIKRKYLHHIYTMLDNDEKKSWAYNANYTSYIGLYRYLTTNVDNIAYERVVRGLYDTVGEKRFNDFIEEISNKAASNNTSDTDTNTDNKNSMNYIVKVIKENLIPALHENNNMTQLEELKNLLNNALKITSNTLENLQITEQLKATKLN